METRIACIGRKKRVLRCHFCNDIWSAGVLFVGITQRLLVGHWVHVNGSFTTIRKLQEKTFVTGNSFPCIFRLVRSFLNEYNWSFLFFHVKATADIVRNTLKLYWCEWYIWPLNSVFMIFCLKGFKILGYYIIWKYVICTIKDEVWNHP